MSDRLPLDCVPQGICSWNFVASSQEHYITGEFAWMSEQGMLTVDDVVYQIRKPSIFQGRWSLESQRGTVCTAQKTSIFSRAIQITDAGQTSVLSAESMFGRAMVLEGPLAACRISPAHAFTRRCTVEGRWQDITCVSFALWLTMLTWRRAQRNKNGGGA